MWSFTLAIRLSLKTYLLMLSKIVCISHIIVCPVEYHRSGLTFATFNFITRNRNLEVMALGSNSTAMFFGG